MERSAHQESNRQRCRCANTGRAGQSRPCLVAAKVLRPNPITAPDPESRVHAADLSQQSLESPILLFGSCEFVEMAKLAPFRDDQVSFRVDGRTVRRIANPILPLIRREP